MTEGEGPGDVRVYKYAVHGDLPPEAVTEMFRAHQLRNNLVEVEQVHAERVAQVWARRPELARLATEVEAAQARVDEAVEAGKADRQRLRSTEVPADVRAKVKEARAALREAKAALRDAKARWYPELKPLLVEAGEQRKADIKALYRPAVDAGLYWATFNDVRSHHEVAVRQVAAQRKQGKRADMRFHRWVGEGTLAVQLQRGAGDPPRSPAALGDLEGRWRNTLTVTPVLDPDEWATLSRSEQNRRKREGRLRFRIGTGEHATIIEVPVTLHRPLPVDADIPLARITRRLVAGKARVSVSFTVKLPGVPQRVEGPVVAVHIGWRSLPGGDLRLAVVKGGAPVPESLRGVARDHGGWAEIVLPARLRQRLEHCEGLQSQRDRNLDVLRAEVVAWAAEHPEVEGLENVVRWRSPSRFAALALRWRDDPPPGGEALAAAIEAWRKQDKHLWSWEANQRDNVLAARRKLFEEVAAWLLADAALLVVDSWDIDTRVPLVEEVDDYQQRAARANRVLAAPGELRSQLVLSAAARGVFVSELEPGSAKHRACGTPFDVEQKRDDIMVSCATCGVVVDQDYNALMTLAERAVR